MQRKQFINKYFKSRSPAVIWRNWHGLLGVIVAIPLLALTITGLLLNHSEELNLTEVEVRSEWVLERYGFETDQPVVAKSLVGGGFISTVAGDLVYRGAIVGSAKDSLIGGAHVQNGLCIATETEVHYFDDDGKLVETLGSTSLPSGVIQNVGRDQNQLLVLQLTGETGVEKTVRFDSELIQATEEIVDGVEWSEEKSLSDTERDQVHQALISEGMPLDRLILDLHSGRFFGDVGKWLLTLFSLLLILVSISGLVVFFRNQTRRRRDCLKDCAAPCGDL